MSAIRGKLRDPVLIRFFLSQQLTTTAQFGAFFTVYQTSRCLLLHQTNLDKYQATAVAAAAGLGPFLPSRLFRRNLVWACALVGMDIYSGGLDRR